MAQGDSLEDSMRRSLGELDGVFTYICVTEDALGVAKDELGAKPLVLYESDDIVALASEEIAIRKVVDREIETYDPYEGAVMVWTSVTATYDARGLVELDGTIPKVSEIDGERAVLDARELSTRKINAELRWLLYEQGVKDVTILNPERAPLARRRHPDALPDHLRGQPRLLRLRADRRPRGADQRPRRLVGRREHDVRASS